MQITLEQTCGACPEQYDATDETGRQVGYLRLRHGTFRVECPDVGGTQVYHANPMGDGIFRDDERSFYLTEAKLAIEKFYRLENARPKYVVAYISFFDNVLKQEVIYGASKTAVMREYLKLDANDLAEVDTEEKIYDYANGCDSCINAIEI